MKKELVKFANGASYDVQNIRSTDNALDFEVQDVDKNALETILADKDNVGIIKYMQKDTDTQDETLLKAYAGYVNLSRMNTLYGYLWWIDEQDNGYAAMGDGGNIIYVRSDKNMVVASTSLFYPRAKDRIEFIKKYVEPIFEEEK
ncbi:beta-lactamase [Firmicutes bacterium CAG:534]|nr:beta-lactamase [Firmicutes bacterium CAG:534]